MCDRRPRRSLPAAAIKSTDRVVDGASGDAPRQTYSVRKDKLMQVVTIDADGHEDIACPCVPEVFGKSFVEMYNRSPSGRWAVGREVVAVVVAGAA
jgi:hypothetical protein